MGNMNEVQVSRDPRFLRWQTVRVGDPLNLNNTCYAYAVGDDATIENYANRPVGSVMRPPQVGDAFGINEQIYGMVQTMTADRICDLAEKDGLRRLPTPGVGEKLPEASPGHRLVAMFFGRHPTTMEYEYHWLRSYEGEWSQKFGHKALPKQVDAEGKLITDPRSAKFYLMQQGPFFFEVPKDGLDLRVRPELGQLIDDIHREHEDMTAQSKKRRVNLQRPALASKFRRLAGEVAEKDSSLSQKINLLAQLHTTGKPPAGMVLRQGLFK